MDPEERDRDTDLALGLCVGSGGPSQHREAGKGRKKHKDWEELVL